MDIFQLLSGENQQSLLTVEPIPSLEFTVMTVSLFLVIMA